MSRYALLTTLILIMVVGCGQPSGDSVSESSHDTAVQLSFAGPPPQSSLGRLGKSTANAISYTPDGETVLIGGDAGIFAYSVKELREVWSLHCLNPITALAVSPDGRLLATGQENGSVTLIDLESQDTIRGGMNEGVAEVGVYSLAWLDFAELGGDQILAIGYNDGSVLLSQISSENTEGGSHPEVTLIDSLDQQSSGVISMAFSPNGRVLATGTRNGSISLWESGAWEWIGFLEGHEAAHGITSLAWSSDGSLLLSGGRDEKLILWDMKTLQPKFTFDDLSSEIVTANIGPTDFQVSAVSTGGDAAVWEIDGESAELTGMFDTGALTEAVYLPRSNGLISIMTSGDILVWNLDEKGAISGPNQALLGYSGLGERIASLAWHPGGGRIASVLGPDVMVWDAALAAPVLRLVGHEVFVGGVDWSGDGSKIASGDANGVVKIWNAATGEELVSYQNHMGTITNLRFAPDSQFLAAAGSVDDSITIADSESGEVLHRLEGTGSGVWSLGWSPDGEWIAGGTANGEILLWNLKNVSDPAPDQIMRKHLNWISGISFSPDGEWLASSSADNRIVLTKLDSEDSITYAGHSGVVRSVEFNSEGDRLVSAARDGLVIVWDSEDPQVNSENLAVYEGHTGGVNDARWSPDDERIASGGDDGTVLIWPADGK